MMSGLATRTRVSRRRPGMTLVEVVMCTLLVSVVLVGAMNMLGAVVRGRVTTSDTARAQQMAQQLMAEILNTAYGDDSLPVFGRELLEQLDLSGTRNGFDDVDDYHGWSSSPPESRDGTALANSAGWRHAVTVELVNPANPSATAGSDGGVKRVTVSVDRGGSVLARLVALRSDRFTP